MSKFKIGDRVRLLSDATDKITASGRPAPEFGKRGEIGIIEKIDDEGDICVDGVGTCGSGYFHPDQLEHVDAPVQPVDHPTVTAAHAAIDRLVTHLEREATEHVHALDALRAECESLRAINGNLREEVARLTHLVEESRRIHEVNAAVDLG